MGSGWFGGAAADVYWGSIPVPEFGGFDPCMFCLSFSRRCRTLKTDPAAGAGTWSAGQGP